MREIPYPKIILKSGKERSIQRLHPWIFSGAIKKIEGNALDGEIVAVYDNDDKFLGLGHYQKIGSISVRIFSFSEIEPNYEFWKQKIINAITVRKNLGYTFNNPETNVCRLIHGEGDGFPGFICDFYNGILVFQAHSRGMYNLEETFAKIFREILTDKVTTIYDKSDKTLPKSENLVPNNHFIFGNEEEKNVSEYGMNFYVNIVEGQKTGYFIDQRENRKLLQQYSFGKTVLNMFCYTGGFSVSALKGGAKSVTSIDASKTAIEQTVRNCEYNGFDNHEAIATDAFEYLDKMAKNHYDLIILDPPAFAKHNNTTNQAVKGYTRINRTAMEKIAPNSILFTFSCSQAIDKQTFRMAVMEASLQAKRKIRILHQLTQPNDHPISIYHPEGEYLKGLVLFVE